MILITMVDSLSFDLWIEKLSPAFAVFKRIPRYLHQRGGMYLFLNFKNNLLF